MGEEKSALFGVKGRKAEKENSCSFQKTPLGNPPATRKEDQFAQVYIGGKHKLRSTFPGFRPSDALGKACKEGQKEDRVQKSCPLSRALTKDEKGFAFIVIADGFILFLGIISVYLV